jgi:hypothetical protein
MGEVGLLRAEHGLGVGTEVVTPERAQLPQPRGEVVRQFACGDRFAQRDVAVEAGDHDIGGCRSQFVAQVGLQQHPDLAKLEFADQAQVVLEAAHQGGVHAQGAAGHAKAISPSARGAAQRALRKALAQPGEGGWHLTSPGRAGITGAGATCGSIAGRDSRVSAFALKPAGVAGDGAPPRVDQARNSSAATRAALPNATRRFIASGSMPITARRSSGGWRGRAAPTSGSRQTSWSGPAPG